MRKFFFACLLLSTLFGCKTTEQNYRNAYFTAKESQRQEVDSDTDSKIVHERNGREVKSGNITLQVKSGYYSEVEPAENGGKPARFSVVVGQFKQIFNARMFRNRLLENNSPAYILRDGASEYYVVSKGFDTLEAASDYIERIDKNVSVRIPIEPFVIKNAAVK